MWLLSSAKGHHNKALQAEWPEAQNQGVSGVVPSEGYEEGSVPVLSGW